jgi:ectoine hydroxylase-related dioxygenase (phytanoyl-CoA dioxygenase family)
MIDAEVYAIRDSFMGMERAAQIRSFETEGYVVLPNALDPDLIVQIKSELASLPMRSSFFTDAPAFSEVPPHTRSPACAALIAHPPALAFLQALMGEELVFMHSFYILSHPGAPALDIHTDYQPYGSTYSGWLESCPIRVRVLYYLDDTGLDRSALRTVPRSHICFHADAQPYRRYKRHPDELLVPMRAGDAFVFATRMFHGAGANTTQETRGMMEFDYRPTWSRPYQPLPEWSAEEMVLVPEPARALTRGRNFVDFAWEFDVKRQSVDLPAPGMSPGRWDKTGR